MRNILLFNLIILLSSPCLANDFKFIIGSSVGYINNKNDKYEYINKDEEIFIPKFFYGVAYAKNNFYISATTNRFVEQNTERSAKTNNGMMLNIESETKIDSLSIGAYKNNILATINIYNVFADQEINYNNYVISKVKENELLYGFGINTPLSKYLSFGVYYIFPNKELSMTNAYGSRLTLSF